MRPSPLRSAKTSLLIAALLLSLGVRGYCQEPDASEPPTAQEIVRRSLAHWRRNLDAIRNYTFQQRTVDQQLEKNGSPKKTEIKTYEISIIYGEPYRKLIARDDQPLSEKDQKKEEEKLEDFFKKQSKRTDADREREREKDREKFQHEIADELPLMLNYELLGEDNFNGQGVWVLRATPRSDYKSSSRAGKLLSKLSGTVWITKADYQWVKVEADLSDDFSVGWFLFKLHKGTHLEFEQTRVNDEVWLPKRVFIQGSGRVAVATGRFRNEATYSDYHKFTAESKITGVVEEPARDLPPTEPAK